MSSAEFTKQVFFPNASQNERKQINIKRHMRNVSVWLPPHQLSTIFWFSSLSSSLEAEWSGLHALGVYWACNDGLLLGQCIKCHYFNSERGFMLSFSVSSSWIEMHHATYSIVKYYKANNNSWKMWQYRWIFKMWEDLLWAKAFLCNNYMKRKQNQYVNNSSLW